MLNIVIPDNDEMKYTTSRTDYGSGTSEFLGGFCIKTSLRIDKNLKSVLCIPRCREFGEAYHIYIGI